MGFNMGDFDHSSGSGFGPYEAEVINAGITHGDRGAQLVFVCKPTNPKRRTQTLFYSMGKGVYTLGGVSEVIVTGTGEKAFENTIHKEIMSGPKINIMTNAGLFLNALKHQGFELVGGDMSVYIGLKLDLEEIASNEAIRRFNELHPKSPLDERTGDYATKITIPTKIISMPVKKVSLKEAALEVIEGKSESEMVTWYKTTEYYNGTATTPLRKLLMELEDNLEVLTDNDKYMVKKETTKA